jgi:methylase of polypeptide subunit release factors
MVAPAPGTRRLDAGCGSGWLSRRIAAWMPDREVLGIDTNPDRVAFASHGAREAGRDNLGCRPPASPTCPSRTRRSTRSFR